MTPNSVPILVTGATGTVGRHVVQGPMDRGVDAIAVMRPPGGRSAPVGRPARHRGLVDLRCLRRREEGFPRPIPRLTRVWKSIFPALDAAERRGVARCLSVTPRGRAEPVRAVPVGGSSESCGGRGWSRRLCGRVSSCRTSPRRTGRTFATATRLSCLRAVGAPASSISRCGRHRCAGARRDEASANRLRPDRRRSARLLRGRGALLRGTRARDPVPQPVGPPRYPSQVVAGPPWPFVLLTTGVYLAAQFGLAAPVTGDLETILGRPPIPMRDFIRDYQLRWIPDRGR